MKNFCLFLLLVLICQINHPLSADSAQTSKTFKLLHLTFHKGCQKEIEAMGEKCGIEVVTWFIPALPSLFLDGESTGNMLYNITHNRAESIWNKHKDFFEQFDAVLTSDTAPLCRIFLQNGWEKPLIIWICNRFDYADKASLDGNFPDAEYYALFQSAVNAPNVTMIAYTEFEHYYAKTKGIDTGRLTITPCAPYIDVWESTSNSNSQGASLFFLPPYHNETKFMDLSAWLGQLGIPNFCGRYTDPYELTQYRGIIHLPYSWSNLAFFENTALGIPYFIPSVDFFKELATHGNYFHPNLYALLQENLFSLSEWYSPANSKIITYFGSWDDLVYKIQTMNFQELRRRIKVFAQLHQDTTLARWKKIFDNIRWQSAEHSSKPLPHCSVLSFEGLDLSRAALLKTAQDSPHTRSVYYDTASNKYIKIWSENYPQADNFLKALQDGFYERLAPLEAILMDKENRCRGYVTKGLKNSNLQLGFCKNQHGSACLQIADLQNDAYKAFYESLLFTSQEKGLYYLDLTPGNILLNENRYYLADLECVYSREQLFDLSRQAPGKFAFTLDHLPKDYALFLKSIVQ